MKQHFNQIPHLFLGNTPIVMCNPDGLKLDVDDNNDKPSYHPTAFELEIEVGANDTITKELDALFDDKRMNVVVRDIKGREIHVDNASLTTHLHVFGRIPRKMKKRLKKQHGLEWLYYHPNVERKVEINGGKARKTHFKAF